MKEIKLTHGKSAIVDDEDYDYLNQWKWYATNAYKSLWYAQTSKINKKTVSMHQYIMKSTKGTNVDHINGNGLDNRKSNLRICTHAQNSANRGKQSNNTSGYKGVTFYKKMNKWMAKIRENGKWHTIGYFQNVIDAAIAYDKFARIYHGKYANLNFPDRL